MTRIIWQKEFDDLLKSRLTPEELAEYEASFAEAPTNLEDMRRASDIQQPLFLQAVGCRAVDDFRVFRDESLEVAKTVLGGDVTQYSKTRATPAFRAALQKIARKYMRKRKCHINLRAIVCYCDETTP